MRLWYFLIFLLLGVTLWMFLREDAGAVQKEGFTFTEDDAKTLDSQQSFLRRLFHYQLPLVSGRSPAATQQFLYDVGATKDIPNFAENVSAALTSSHIYNDNSPVIDYTRSMKGVAFDDKKEKAKLCLPILKPEDINDTNRPPGSEEGCGWVYRATGSSQAAYGKASGPLVTLKPLLADDKWVWDKAEAIKMEEIKRCAAITDCGLLPTDQSCAFCPGTGGVGGKGVPLDPITGTLKYPNNTSCSGFLIKTTQGCPVITGANGAPIPISGCTDAMNKDCVGKLLKALGFAENGKLYLYVTGSSISESVINNLLSASGASVKANGIKSATTVSRQTLEPQLKAILDARSSSDPLVKAAAFELVDGDQDKNGGKSFNMCDYLGNLAASKDSAKRALALQCLQQEFRIAGCQATGAEYPSTANMTSLNGLTLSAVREKFSKLYARMNTATRVSEQQTAIKDCLGTSGASGAGSSSGPFCQERGIEYFVFSGTTYIGRIISLAGLLMDPAVPPSTNNPAATELKSRLAVNRNGDVSYIARTMMSVPPGSATVIMKDTWYVPADAYTVSVNGQPGTPELLQQQTNSPFLRPYIWTTTLGTEDRNMLEVTYVGKPTASWGRPQYTYIQNNLQLFQLFQESTKPVIALNFFRRTAVDANAGFAKVLDGDITFESRGERVGMTWKVKPPAPGLTVRVEKPRVEKAQIDVLSMMIFPVEGGGKVFHLFESVEYEEFFEITNTSVVYVVRRGTSEDRKVIDTSATFAALLNRWVHLVIDYKIETDTFDPRLHRQKLTVFLDSKPIGTFKHEIRGLQGFRRDVEIQLMDTSFQGYMAWFHMYDRFWKVDNVGGTGSVRDVKEGFRSRGAEGFLSLTDLVKADAATDAATDKEGVVIPVAESATANPPAARNQYEPILTKTGAAEPEIYTNKKFTEPVKKYVTSNKPTTKECAKACQDDDNCLGFSFTATEGGGGTCDQFNQLTMTAGVPETATKDQTISGWTGRNRELIDARTAAAEKIKLFYGVTYDPTSGKAGYSPTQPSLVNFLRSIEVKSTTTGDRVGNLYDNAMYPMTRGFLTETNTEPRSQSAVKTDLEGIYIASTKTAVDTMATKYT